MRFLPEALKPLAFVITHLLFINFIYGQTSGDYRSVKTGDWNASDTWEIYDINTWVTATVAPNNTNGVITIQNGHTVTVNTVVSVDQVVVDGNLTINSGFLISVVNGTGTDLTVNGTITNSGTILNTSSGTVVGTIQFNPNSTYIHSRNGGNIPISNWDPSSTCLITGYANSEIGGIGQAFGNFTWNCASQGSTGFAFAITGMSIAGDFTIINTGTGGTSGGYLEIKQSDLAIGGDLIINGGTLRVGVSTSCTYNIEGSVYMDGGTLMMSWSGKSSTIKVAGDFSHTSGAITETDNGFGSIEFDGTGIQTYTSGGTVSNTINFTIYSGATLQMADESTVITGGGTFTLSAGGTLGIRSTSGIWKTAASGNIRVTGTRSYDANANYIYNGSGAQETGDGLTSAQNLTINNVAGVTLSQEVNVSGVLTLTSGQLTTASNKLLVLKNGASVTGASNTSFIEGPAKKIGNTGFTFPIGKNNKYLPIEISAPQLTTDAFTAEYIPENAAALGTITSPGLLSVSNCEYWNLERTSGNSDVDVTLYWDSDNACSISDPSTVVVAHFKTSDNTWNAHDGESTGSISSGSVTWQDVSEFSPFTFGFVAASVLPVRFSNIKASEKSTGVQIEFTNLTESDINYYEVERSFEGQTFHTVKKLIPGKNDFGLASYTWIDTSAAVGRNMYRIKAVEVTGKVVYSNTTSLITKLMNHNIIVYAQGNQMKLQISNLPAGKYQFRVLNVAGQLVNAENINHRGGSFSRSSTLNHLKTGIYIIDVTGQIRIQKKFAVW